MPRQSLNDSKEKRHTKIQSGLQRNILLFNDVYPLTTLQRAPVAVCNRYAGAPAWNGVRERLSATGSLPADILPHRSDMCGTVIIISDTVPGAKDFR